MAGRNLVNLKVNLPKEKRTLFVGNVLHVYWLALPGDTLPGNKEYVKEVDPVEVQAALKAMDDLLAAGERVPSTLMTSWEHKKTKVHEVKAPQRGREIYRLLCHRSDDWNLYVALARQKKTQAIPKAWKDTAVARIKKSMKGGGP